MHVRVQKWGNSLAVRIPKPLAEDAEVKEGTVLNLALSDGKVVETPVRRGKLSLTQLLAKVNRNLHTEVELGSPIGRPLKRVTSKPDAALRYLTKNLKS